MSIASDFEQTIHSGGVALFPADTVYGLACDPENPVAIDRLYAIKQRPPDKSAAVMFFELEAALTSFPELGESTVSALKRLLPGALTLLLPNPANRFALTCNGDPHKVGLRVISVPPMVGVSVPVLQSSANISGGRDASRLVDVDGRVKAAADLVIDGGVTLGQPSTIVDLTSYERDGSWSIVRRGAVASSVIDAALRSS